MDLRREDIATIPNAISATGFALVVDGARKIDKPLGLAEVAVGRALDLADGHVARATGQSSEFGAAVDANFDKFGGFAILVAEWRKDIAPKPALAGMFAQNLVNGVATAVAMKRHPDEKLKPSTAGKYAMFTQNVALFSYAAADIAKESAPRVSKFLHNVGHVATIVGVGVLGSKATIDYIKRAR